MRLPRRIFDCRSHWGTEKGHDYTRSPAKGVNDWIAEGYPHEALEKLFFRNAERYFDAPIDE